MDDAALHLDLAADNRNYPTAPSRRPLPDEENGWTRLRISRIECVSDTLLGARLTAMQMSRGPMTDSLAFAEHDAPICSSGYVGARVALAGPLSEDMVTFGFGLDIAPAKRHWLNEHRTGDFGVFLQGDEHGALYTPGSLYVAATLSAERQETVSVDSLQFPVPLVGNSTRNPDSRLSKEQSQTPRVDEARFQRRSNTRRGLLQ